MDGEKDTMDENHQHMQDVVTLVSTMVHGDRLTMALN